MCGLLSMKRSSRCWNQPLYEKEKIHFLRRMKPKQDYLAPVRFGLFCFVCIADTFILIDWHKNNRLGIPMSPVLRVGTPRNSWKIRFFFVLQKKSHPVWGHHVPKYHEANSHKNPQKRGGNERKGVVDGD